MKPASSSKNWLPAIVCALAGAAVFQFFGNATRGYIDSASLFYWWGFQWFNPQSETEHGPLIVAVAAWLCWRKLRIGEGGNQKPESYWPTVAALVGGLALHAAGFAAQQARVSCVALLVFGWGVLRLGGGRRWGAAAAFPLGFLMFAIPFDALDSAGFWLRLWVVAAGEKLAHLAGLGVVRSGTQLFSADGRFSYDVAAACSGVRSLVALAALSLLLGYLSFRSWPRRALVLALCGPLVFLGNVARITAIIFAAQLGGQEWGARAHEVMGWGVFVIVLGGALAAVRGLERWWPERAASKEETEKGNEETAPRRRAGWGVVVAVGALAAGEMFFLAHLAALPARGAAGVVLAADGKNPAELPAFVGDDWIGRRAEVTAVERDILPPDTGFARRNYISLAGGGAHAVFVSIVLSGRDRTSIHRPELCLVGQGWTLRGTVAQEFSFPGGGKFPATLLRTERTDARGKKLPALVAYWFVGGDVVVATHAQRLWHDAWNRLAHARADRWAYVLVQADAADGEAAALARMQAVLDGTLPRFQRPGSAR